MTLATKSAQDESQSASIPVLETERLTLRAPQRSDVKAIVAPRGRSPCRGEYRARFRIPMAPPMPSNSSRQSIVRMAKRHSP